MQEDDSSIVEEANQVGQPHVLYVFIFVVLAVMSLYERADTIGSPWLDSVKINVVWGFGLQDLACLFLVVFLLSPWAGNWRRALVNRYLMAGMLFVAAALIVGLAQHHYAGTSFLTNDMRGFLWFFGGMGMGIILCLSGVFWGLLTCYTAALGILLYLSAVMSPYYVETASKGIRLYAFNLYEFATMMIVPLCLITVGSFPGRRWRLIIPTALFFIYVYTTVLLAATRSNLLIVILAVGLCAVALLRHLGSASQRNRRLVAACFIGGMALVAAVTVLNEFIENAVDIDNSRIISRVTDPDADSTISMRLEEVKLLFYDLSLPEYITGRGLGGYFFSETGATPALHIGIFYYLLKGGFGLFLFACMVFYFWVPRLFLRALSSSNFLNPPERAAALIAIPGILVVGMLQLMSGSFNEITAQGLGLSYFTYFYVRSSEEFPIFGAIEDRRAPH